MTRSQKGCESFEDDDKARRQYKWSSPLIEGTGSAMLLRVVGSR